MLPTPDTSHVPYERVYEPAEDSFLLLDTLASDGERRFLRRALGGGAAGGGGAPAPAPLVVEVGMGSGVVLAFVHAHARRLLGAPGALTTGVDVNAFACRATAVTVAKAQRDAADADADADAASSSTTNSSSSYLGACVADLASPWRDGCVDVLLFNPPYVPTPALPARPPGFDARDGGPPSFDDDAYLLALAYAGGADGMETTDRLVAALPRLLSPRGCAYLVLCAQNKPDLVRRRVRAWGPQWRALAVGSSGKTTGWEKLQVVRIWRDAAAHGA